MKYENSREHTEKKRSISFISATFPCMTTINNLVIHAFQACKPQFVITPVLGSFADGKCSDDGQPMENSDGVYHILPTSVAVASLHYPQHYDDYSDSHEQELHIKQLLLLPFPYVIPVTFQSFFRPQHITSKVGLRVLLGCNISGLHILP